MFESYKFICGCFVAVKLENEVIIVLRSVSTIVLCGEKSHFACVLRENKK